MYKMWGKKIKNHKIKESVDVSNGNNISQAERRDKCIGEICRLFDLSVPVWLEKHNREFEEYGHVTFYPGDFIDDIDFDKLEIELVDDGTERK